VVGLALRAIATVIIFGGGERLVEVIVVLLRSRSYLFVHMSTTLPPPVVDHHFVNLFPRDHVEWVVHECHLVWCVLQVIQSVVRRIHLQFNLPPLLVLQWRWHLDDGCLIFHGHLLLRGGGAIGASARRVLSFFGRRGISAEEDWHSALQIFFR
jgi:hypothetical protein